MGGQPDHAIEARVLGVAAEVHRHLSVAVGPTIFSRRRDRQYLELLRRRCGRESRQLIEPSATSAPNRLGGAGEAQSSAAGFRLVRRRET